MTEPKNFPPPSFEEVETWQNAARDNLPDLPPDRVEVLAPVSTRVVGTPDGAMLVWRNPDGTQDIMRLNALLATRVMEELHQAGRLAGWRDSEGNIRSAPPADPPTRQ